MALNSRIRPSCASFSGSSRTFHQDPSLFKLLRLYKLTGFSPRPRFCEIPCLTTAPVAAASCPPQPGQGRTPRARPATDRGCGTKLLRLHRTLASFQSSDGLFNLECLFWFARFPFILSFHCLGAPCLP